MNRCVALFCILFALLSANLAAAKTSAATVRVKYEGGTLPLGQGTTHVTFAENKVVFIQGERKLAIPLQNITTIACNTDVRRRFGASVLGIVPVLHLDTAETYYVGLTWTGNTPAGTRMEGVFRLSAGEYGDFLMTLERLTGKSAIDTHRVPAVVRYGL